MSINEKLAFNSSVEREHYYGELKLLKAEGGLSQDEMELMAYKALEGFRQDHEYPY